LLKTVEADIERPRSPWMPSFQVTTVGRGVYASTEDEQPQQPKSQESAAVPVAPSNDLDELWVATPAIEAGQPSDNTSQVEHVAPQVS
jgi:hypothetical protein